MIRKSGLGRGLDALIPGGGTTFQPKPGEVSNVRIDQIVPNPRQPRHKMKPDDLQDLSDSIKEHGILQPLLVTLDEETHEYILIAGERRLRAASLAGLQTVPVIIRQATEQQRLELALIENVQRADLTPLETAEAYRQLSQEFHMTQDEIAQRVGKSRPAVTNTLRLLDLPDTVRQALAEEDITEGHARALLGLLSPQLQELALAKIVENGLTVRQTEELVKELKNELLSNPQPPEKSLPHLPKKLFPSPEIQDLQKRLEDELAAKVSIHHSKNGKGTITIHYFNDEDLNTVINKIFQKR